MLETLSSTSLTGPETGVSLWAVSAFDQVVFLSLLSHLSPLRTTLWSIPGGSGHFSLSVVLRVTDLGRRRNCHSLTSVSTAPGVVCGPVASACPRGLIEMEILG